MVHSWPVQPHHHPSAAGIKGEASWFNDYGVRRIPVMLLIRVLMCSCACLPVCCCAEHLIVHATRAGTASGK